MVTVDFDDTYELDTIAQNLSFATFYCEKIDWSLILLKIEIEPHPDPLLPAVYNLCFGPLDANGNIDDNARVNHQSRNRMFSTVLLFALMFLKDNKQITIGLDGSNDVRAYLYHRMFQTNFAVLNEYFDTIGVDWYSAPIFIKNG